MDEAIYWVERLKFPRARLPHIVQDELTYRESGRQALPVDDYEDWDADGSNDAVSPMPATLQTVRSAPPTPAAASSWAPEETGWSCDPVKPVKFLELQLDLEKIVFVDSKEKFEACKKEIREEVRLRSLWVL